MQVVVGGRVFNFLRLGSCKGRARKPSREGEDPPRTQERVRESGCHRFEDLAGVTRSEMVVPPGRADGGSNSSVGRPGAVIASRRIRLSHSFLPQDPRERAERLYRKPKIRLAFFPPRAFAKPLSGGDECQKGVRYVADFFVGRISSTG